MSIKQRHQYVCLIWRQAWINVNDFSKMCDQVLRQSGGEDYSSLGHPYCVVDKSVG
jgi:hypothetical protein